MVSAQNRPQGEVADLRLRLTAPGSEKRPDIPAVAWLEPLTGTPAPAFASHSHFTLIQKNRMFVPHLLVIPVGSVVQFPNEDPFFHNVFSLFDGKRFDLGLYEAGSSKSITFSREGVSYIFCNIHPEMSAVILTLSTPLYAVADVNHAFLFHNIPRGDYRLHFWVEGVLQANLESLGRQVHLSRGTVDLGDLVVPLTSDRTLSHANKFGRAYDQNPAPTY
jgi:plastocyanin